MDSIVVIGSGGHAVTVIDTIEAEGKLNIEAVLCDFGQPGCDMLGYPLLGNLDLLKNSDLPKKGVVAIGDSFFREQNVIRIKEICPDFHYISILHPLSYISKNVEIGCGNVIQADVVLQNGVILGSHCHINPISCVGHDSKINGFNTIGFGVMIGGSVSIGTGTVINMGTCIRDRINIGEYSVIGMGSVVTNDLPSFVVAYGSPAKVARGRKKNDGFL